MGCINIPEQGYDEFSLGIFDKISNQRFPIAGSLELTFRCNLRCKHCYVAHGHQGIPGHKELDYPEIQRILDEVVDEGCLWFLITGGEPLMRRDFMDIYTYAKRKGLIVSLFTNGTLLTPRIADQLAEWTPFSIELTLYGYTQETYERVTGIPGSHARCMRGIELLLERGLPLKLKSMLMTLNKHDLKEMQSFADRLGVEFRFDPIINPGLELHDMPFPLRLSPREVVQIEREDPSRSSAWPKRYRDTEGLQTKSRLLYLCGAGRKAFHIDPYGKLCPCMSARLPNYDLRSGSFQQGWNNFLAEFQAQEFDESYECSRCDLRLNCAQCPAMAQLENGDPNSRVAYLCEVAHLRAQAFGGLSIEDMKTPAVNEFSVYDKIVEVIN